MERWKTGKRNERNSVILHEDLLATKFELSMKQGPKTHIITMWILKRIHHLLQ